jgi:hypothetical protein
MQKLQINQIKKTKFKSKLGTNLHLHGTRIVTLDIFLENHVQQQWSGRASIEYNPFYPVGKTRSDCQHRWPNNRQMANRPSGRPVGHAVDLGGGQGPLRIAGQLA